MVSFLSVRRDLENWRWLCLRAEKFRLAVKVSPHRCSKQHPVDSWSMRIVPTRHMVQLSTYPNNDNCFTRPWMVHESFSAIIIPLWMQFPFPYSILPCFVYLSSLGQLSLHTTGEDYDALLLQRQPNFPDTNWRIIEIQPYKSCPESNPAHAERQEDDLFCMWSR